jgi:hypothetical protein
MSGLIATHPVGQQAGLLLASRAHRWPCWQQMLLKAAPWSAQLKKLAMHAWRFATGAAVLTGRKGCRLAQTAGAQASTARNGRLVLMLAGGWRQGNADQAQRMDAKAPDTPVR